MTGGVRPAASDFDSILVIADRVPGGDPADRRLLQLLCDLRTILPAAVLRLSVTDAPEGATTVHLAELGVEVLDRRTSPVVWLAAHRCSVTMAVLAGRASARRLIPVLRRTQPQASLWGLLPTLAPLLSGSASRFVVHEEQLGADLAAAASRSRDAAVLRSLDGLLCADEVDDRRAATDAPETPRFRYSGRVEVSAHPRPFSEREGLLSWGTFGREQGDPDEEAAFLITDQVAPLVDALAPGLSVTTVLDGAPSGLSALTTPATTRRALLGRRRALLVARPFGTRAWADALAVEAAEVGTPVVALDGSLSSGVPHRVAVDAQDLARIAVRIATDQRTWDEASASATTWASEEPDRPGSELVALLQGQGFDVRRSARRPLPRVQGADVCGPRTVQGQVQSEGFAQHRATSLAFARADLTPDQLWPHVAYEAWYDAHPLEDGGAVVRSIAATLPDQPLISIVMPVYDTDPTVLSDAIESVMAQTYPHWELCAVDDASPRDETVQALHELAARDGRIRVRRLDVNEGIVGASNAALAMTTGAFVALLDHDDILSPDALFEVVTLLNEEPDLDFVYSDEDKLDLEDRRTTPFFKPSWSPHLHLGVNYVTHFAVYRRSLLDQIGGFRPGFDGSQDYDLSLRASEVARRIGHIAKPIYTWRMVEGSAAVAHDAKPYALDAARRALGEALERRGLAATVQRGLVPGTWRPRYRIDPEPLVSILIPTRNGRRLLERCIDTVTAKTTYRNFEIVIIDNGSDDEETLAYLRQVDAEVVHYPYRFNYARQMNLAVDAARGDHVLFLNNDVEVVSPGWLGAMVELAQLPDVGAVGARLLYPSGRPQHEGVFVGYGGGSAGNVDFGGYFGLGQMIRDATAVTAACMLMRVEPFHAIGGFDERLRVAFNDVDLCLRLRQRGYKVLYTPYAEFFHAESASRGKLHPMEDEDFFVRRWGPSTSLRDPFYNPNLDPIRPFRLRR